MSLRLNSCGTTGKERVREGEKEGERDRARDKQYLKRTLNQESHKVTVTGRNGPF